MYCDISLGVTTLLLCTLEKVVIDRLKMEVVIDRPTRVGRIITKEGKNVTQCYDGNIWGILKMNYRLLMIYNNGTWTSVTKLLIYVIPSKDQNFRKSHKQKDTGGVQKEGEGPRVCSDSGHNTQEMRTTDRNLVSDPTDIQLQTYRKVLRDITQMFT